MARTTDQPSAAIRPNLARAQDPLDEGGPHLHSKVHRRESLSAVRSEPDNDCGDTRGGHREQPPTPAAGSDAFAPTLEAWRQVFLSWSEWTETMVKAQQDAFASMISAANSMNRR